jgi:creatinine amidohydrolase
MDRAYTGAPAEATREEGEDLFAKLVTMVVTEIEEALAPRPLTPA